jgi:hypothetical protein
METLDFYHAVYDAQHRRAAGYRAYRHEETENIFVDECLE